MFDLERQLLCFVLHESLFMPALQTSLFHHHRHYNRYLGSDPDLRNNDLAADGKRREGQRRPDTAVEDVSEVISCGSHGHEGMGWREGGASFHVEVVQLT